MLLIVKKNTADLPCGFLKKELLYKRTSNMAVRGERVPGGIEFREQNLLTTLDLHMGGVAHSIHHTNEIAQSEAANGVKFVDIGCTMNISS